MARALPHSFATLTPEILLSPPEHKIHTFSPPLFVWRRRLITLALLQGKTCFFLQKSARHLYCTILHILLTTIWNSRISVAFSLIGFGVVRDDLVTRTVECAGSGTVFLYIAGTRDLDVEKYAHCGKNSHYVCQQCHFHQKLCEIGKIVRFYPCQNNIHDDFSQLVAWVVNHGHCMK